MRENLYDDADVRRYLEGFEREVLPKMRDSAVHISIMPSPGHVDPKICLELGGSILLGKPLIIFVPDGAAVPEKLSLIADAVVEGSMEDPATKDKFQTELARLIPRLRQ